MIKIKPIIICASVAFVLSFFTALIAKTGLPMSLLKAFIFAVVFGGIAVGIQVVYGKFLLEGEAPAPDPALQQKTIGGKVDLVVSEEDLPNDNEGPSFALDSKRHVLKSEDIGIRLENARSSPVASAPKSSEAPAASEPEKPVASVSASNASESAPASAAAPNSGFVPLDLGGDKGAAPSAPQPQTASGNSNSELPELDEFPGLGGGESVGAKPSDENVIEDSDFAEEGVSKPSSQTEFPDGKIADPKDASLMAEAIRTVLMKEE